MATTKRKRRPRLPAETLQEMHLQLREMHHTLNGIIVDVCNSYGRSTRQVQPLLVSAISAQLSLGQVGAALDALPAAEPPKNEIDVLDQVAALVGEKP